MTLFYAHKIQGYILIMTNFTTRVELFDTNDGTSEEYTKLHIAMEEAGFTRTIKSDDGIEYYLPPAEYNFTGNVTRQDVFDLARAAAAKSGKEFSVFITQANGRLWYKLKKVKTLFKK